MSSNQNENQKKTLSGILKPKFLKSHASNLPEPGTFPYTRGVYQSMYLGRLWTMRMYSGFGSAKVSNERYKKLIQNGSTGLSVAFDLPTQMGLDSDNPLSKGEVGKSGVAIDTVDDMRVLFDGIDLSQISTSMTINSTAGILLAFYIAVAKEKGIESANLRGTIQNDILKEYIARGTYIFPPKDSMRIITDIFEYCKNQVQNWNTISISGYHIREAGSTAVEELAFTLANGLAYVDAAIQSGLKIDDFAKRLSFFFNAHNDFFEEVCKFRAARKLWANLLKERYQAKDESCRLRFHTQTAGSSLTAQQIDNNIVRVAYQSLAAVLGGTQSLHTNSKDEALALPTEESAKLALRTQQVLAFETGVPDSIDPLAGSYYVEHLTDEIYKKSLKLIEKIDELGGAVSAIESGFQQNHIQNSSFAYQKDLESQKLKIVGVNSFQEQENLQNHKILKVDGRFESEQIQNLKNYKAKRDGDLIQKKLKELEDAAKNQKNLMPVFLDLAQNQVTLGEMVTTLKQVFGEFTDSHQF